MSMCNAHAFSCVHVFFVFQAKIIDWLYNRFRNVRSGVKSKSKKSEDNENDSDDETNSLETKDVENEGIDDMHGNGAISSPKGLCETIYLNASGDISSFVDESEIITGDEYSISIGDDSEYKSEI